MKKRKKGQKKKSKLTPFEKILYFITIILVISSPLIVVFLKSTLSKMNYDVEKIKKHARNNKPGFSGYNDIRDELRNLFERATSCPMGLPGSIYEYWENTYVFNNADLTYEPSDENTGKLAAMLAFLNNSDEDQDLITDEDWQEIGHLVNYEAEDLPVNILQELMMVLVSKGAY